MKRFIIFLLLLVILVFGGILGIKMLNPRMFYSLMITFDIAPNSKEEKNRIDKIRLLPISDEKKQILLNHTIFLGASPRMAELALGSPIQTMEYPDVTPQVDRWVYHFADDSRPTVLEFHDNKLVSAFKVSAYKLNMDGNTPPTATPQAQ